MAPKARSRFPSKGKGPADAGPAAAARAVFPFTPAIDAVIPHPTGGIVLGRASTPDGHVETVYSNDDCSPQRRASPPLRLAERPTGGIVLQPDQIQAVAQQVAAILQQTMHGAQPPPARSISRYRPPSVNSRQRTARTHVDRSRGGVFSRLSYPEQPGHQAPSHRARAPDSQGRRVSEAAHPGLPPPPPPGPLAPPVLPPPPPPNHRALLERMDRLERNQRGGRRVEEEERADWAENPPFSVLIMHAPVPHGFKFEPTEFYQGTTDPQDHIDNFESRMLVSGASGAIKCRAFAATLRGVAQAWFKRLPPQSIDSFGDFVRKFKAHFCLNKRTPKRPGDLLTMKQKKGETLKEFISRFRNEALQIRGLDPGMALAALMAGLRDVPLLESLAKTEPASYEELLQRAEKYINAETSRLARAEEAAGTKRAPESSSPPRVKKAKAEKSHFPKQDLHRLNCSRDEILAAVEGEGYVQWPKKMTTKPEGRNADKYCRFHRSYGHETNRCFDLRDEIERLIRRGHLREYVTPSHPDPPPLAIAPPAGGNRPRIAPPPPPRREERRDDHQEDRAPRPERRPWNPPPHQAEPQEDQQPRGRDRAHQAEAGPPAPPAHIYTLHGGLGAGGETSNGRRKYARQVLEASAPKKPRVPREPISFSDDDLDGVCIPHDDALVIQARVMDIEVHRILVDNGASTDILFFKTFQQMGIPHTQLVPARSTVVGISGDPIQPLGHLSVPVVLGEGDRTRRVFLNFVVLDIPSAYNAILGRTGLHALEAIVSTLHLAMKFHTPGGIATVRGQQSTARSCYLTTLKGPRPEEVLPLGLLDPRLSPTVPKPEAMEEVVEYPLNPEDPARKVQIGSLLPPDIRDSLLQLLRDNSEVFAWTAKDVPGISSSVVQHRLSIDPGHPPVKQRKRVFNTARQEAVRAEVKKLLEAGFIKELTYTQWLSNVVLVPKSNGKWRVCIDYSDLNKACPKDNYPLPRIDQMVDATAGHELLSFMDAYSGYNQIQMYPPDEEKTAFITDGGVYCYRRMPFGLKNAGATFQRLINKVFQSQLGRNAEAYVDDILTKSLHAKEHTRDLQETFDSLKAYEVKLNPAKCLFGVTAGKFLGFLISHRGIEVNPEKIRAIQAMKAPSSFHDIQILSGRIAALSRFIARSAEKSLPFFKTLRARPIFTWTDECDHAFEQLKTYLASPPLLARPKDDEILYLYIGVTAEAVSAVIVREESAMQSPVYYISRILRDAELRYPMIEKSAYAVIIAARRLRPYFQGHPIWVLTNEPLKKVLASMDTAGRLIKWSAELSEFDVQYHPRPTIKAQALADFVVECTEPEQSQEVSSIHTPWILFVDGSATAARSGAGLILITSQGASIEYALRFAFPATNNEAEYEALITGIKIARDMGASVLHARSDSQLVVNQLSGEYEARDPSMIRYLEILKNLIAKLPVFKIEFIPREKNEHADALARLATSDYPSSRGIVYVEELGHPATATSEEILPIIPADWWGSKIEEYLRSGALPEGRMEQKKMRHRAPRYILLEGRLYKRGYSTPYLRCIPTEEARGILAEIHEGECGSHEGSRSLARKAFLQGYYHPQMLQEATSLVQRCDKCQRFAPIQRVPCTEMTPITAPWPFAQWGMDILGPFTPAPKKRRFLLVAVDYFTKWVEAEALTEIASKDVKSFLWRNVFTRFGLPRTIVMDHGPQFDSAELREYLENYRVQALYAAVHYPQSNGQAEVTNRTILHGIRTRLDRAKGRWAEELSHVLWAYRTTPREATGETPFRLTYGSEAVIPVELDHVTARVAHYDQERSDNETRLDLDLLDERREAAQMRLAAHQQRAARYYNAKVKTKTFNPGDLVLRSASASSQKMKQELGKLAPNWEGPYRIRTTVKPGTYELETLQGEPFPRLWNSANLRRYFQ